MSDDSADGPGEMCPPFHLAIPVDDLARARRFYGGVLACPEERSAECRVDFDFFGHQLVVHLVAAADRDAVPVPHFGVVLPMPRWRALADRLRDPAGNALEFNGFADVEGQLFAR